MTFPTCLPHPQSREFFAGATQIHTLSSTPLLYTLEFVNALEPTLLVSCDLVPPWPNADFQWPGIDAFGVFLGRGHSLNSEKDPRFFAVDDDRSSSQWYIFLVFQIFPLASWNCTIYRTQTGHNHSAACLIHTRHRSRCNWCTDNSTRRAVFQSQIHQPL